MDSGSCFGVLCAAAKFSQKVTSIHGTFAAGRVVLVHHGRRKACKEYKYVVGDMEVAVHISYERMCSNLDVNNSVFSITHSYFKRKQLNYVS